MLNLKVTIICSAF